MTQPFGKHIPLVDDSADAGDSWAIYLQSRGYRVATAANGPDGNGEDDGTPA